MHRRKTYMHINFQQNRVRRFVKTVHTNLFAKNCKLHKLATTNSNFENRLFKTCGIVKRTRISIFIKLGPVDQSKPCTQINWQKIASCINLQPPIVIFFKLSLSDMHQRKMYMYINFQNRVCRSVKTLHTNLFAKKCKLHKFATCNFKKSRILDMHHPLTDILADFEINRPVRYQITSKRNYFHRRTDGQTDGQTDYFHRRTDRRIISTDGRTDRRTDRRTDGQTDVRTDVAYDNNS